jgi:diguanylate cyclase (GGDEF)-like protein
MSIQPETDPKGTPPDLDLLLCEREPIHTPGAIQPHGAMLVALADGLLVTHASANLFAVLGRAPEAALGRPLAEVIGEEICIAPQTAMSDENSALGQVRCFLGPNGVLDLRAHRAGRHIYVDIEPTRREHEERSSIFLTQSILETFKHTATCGELCELAVAGLRAISGFDRVMAYRFHEDGHGEVIAEARAARLDSYLGLHYPAADVPQQARQLYLRQRVGAIANSSYEPVPLLVDPARDDGTLLDLTHSSLRSVSPIHRQYMRNMGTVASLTIGLAHGSKLWGMLVCHHSKPLVASPELRAVANMIGQVVSLLLDSLSEAEAYAQRFKRNATLRALVDRLEAPIPLPMALALAEAELLELVDAAGAIIRISGELFCLGRTPPRDAAERALAVLYPLADGAILAVDDLGHRHHDLACCTTDGSGAQLLPLAQDSDDAILWFRPERSRTVVWGGNPAEHGMTDQATGQLSPRGSFAAWREVVNGRSAPWTEVDQALVRDVQIAVQSAVALRTKAELARLRHYDPLTSLPNRSLLEDWLRDAAHDNGVTSALLFLDLDGFKAVNDTMGHAAGDALLIEVARRLLLAAGPDNLTARLGGDEFVVLCPKLGRSAAIAVGELVRQAIEKPIEVAGRPCHVSSSIGIAVTGETGGLDLIRAADMAMYAAKQAGGNRAVLFEPLLFDRVSLRFELEQDMRDALSKNDQFVLLYQPLFGVISGTRQLTGFEALVRWRHPRHGWMSPAQFIPLAEKSGLILPLGDWVLATALLQGRAFREANPEANLTMNVNVSALQLPQSAYCSGVAGALEAEGYPPTALCLEVTESMLTDAEAAAVLGDLRKIGVQVAIDDFGVGYSSLSYLRRLPVDTVKLDRSFLVNIEGDPYGVGFVRAVIALAHAAGKPVVFEGIETQAQFDIALATGADVVQGFFFAPPLSANAAEELVVQHRYRGADQPQRS